MARVPPMIAPSRSSTIAFSDLHAGVCPTAFAIGVVSFAICVVSLVESRGARLAVRGGPSFDASTGAVLTAIGAAAATCVPPRCAAAPTAKMAGAMMSLTAGGEALTAWVATSFTDGEEAAAWMAT